MVAGTIFLRYAKCTASTRLQIPLAFAAPQINKICRSIQFRLQTQITTMHFHFSGPARLHLIPHINAPLADLPVLSVVEWRHF
jgi:acetoacetate decarboxylase